MAAHLHWRIHVTANNGGGLLAAAEIELRASVGGADEAGGGTATANDSFSGFGPEKAFDDLVTTSDAWFTNTAPSVGSPKWIAYELTAAKDIVEVAYTTAQADRAPQDFTIEYSDNGSDWFVAETITGETGWTLLEEREFSFVTVIRVAGSLRQPYSAPVAGQLRQPYSQRVAAALRQPYSAPVAGQLRQPYSQRVAAAIRQPYQAPLVAALRQPYSHRVVASLRQPWALVSLVAASLRQPYSESTPVAGQLRQPYSILSKNPVAGQLRQPYALDDPPALFLSQPATLSRGAVDIKMTRYQVDMSEGSWNWTSRIELADPADYASLQYDDPLTLKIGADEWALLVDKKSLVRSLTDERPVAQMVVECLGVAARQAGPRAARITQQWDGAIDAKTAAEAIIGQPITWQIISWTIPAGRLTATDADPIALVRSIVGAVGGVLQAEPDGTLIARPLFPVSVPDWASAVPDQIYTDLGDIIESRDSGGVTRLLDTVVVADQSAALETLELEVDTRETGLNAGRFDFTPGESVGVLGFHERSVAIGAVQSSAGTINGAADQLVDLEEDLLFNDASTAQLLRPADAITSAVWLGASLGAITLEADQKTITAATSGVAMLRVKYQALAAAWQVNTPLTAGGESEFSVGLVAEFEA